MRAVNANIKLIDSYLGLINQLSPGSKLALIKKLNQSIKFKSPNNNKTSLFGAFRTKKPAETLVKEIRRNRTFNRKIESF